MGEQRGGPPPTAEEWAGQRWAAWCDAHGVSPVYGDIGQVTDFVLDLKLAGCPEPELIAALEHAAALTGTWRTSQFATLRLGL